jgi:hypothetical protein
MYTFDIYEGDKFRDQIFAFDTRSLLYSKKYDDMCKKINECVKNNFPSNYSFKPKILLRNTTQFYINKITLQEDLLEDELYDLSLFMANYESPYIFEMLQSNMFVFGNAVIPNSYAVNKLIKADPYKTIILMALFNHQPNKYELIKNYWYETLQKDSATPI